MIALTNSAKTCACSTLTVQAVCFPHPTPLSQGRYRCLGCVGLKATRGVHVTGAASVEDEPLRVWVDQDLCTGDGLCVQYAPEVFQFDIDGLAYVKDAGGDLRQAPRSRVDVPAHLRLEVLDAARECPGDCIHVVRCGDGVEVAGPDAGD